MRRQDAQWFTRLTAKTQPNLCPPRRKSPPLPPAFSPSICANWRNLRLSFPPFPLFNVSSHLCLSCPSVVNFPPFSCLPLFLPSLYVISSCIRVQKRQNVLLT